MHPLVGNRTDSCFLWKLLSYLIPRPFTHSGGKEPHSEEKRPFTRQKPRAGPLPPRQMGGCHKKMEHQSSRGAAGLVLNQKPGMMRKSVSPLPQTPTPSSGSSISKEPGSGGRSVPGGWYGPVGSATCDWANLCLPSGESSSQSAPPQPQSWRTSALILTPPGGHWLWPFPLQLCLRPPAAMFARTLTCSSFLPPHFAAPPAAPLESQHFPAVASLSPMDSINNKFIPRAVGFLAAYLDASRCYQARLRLVASSMFLVMVQDVCTSLHKQY